MDLICHCLAPSLPSLELGAKQLQRPCPMLQCTWGSHVGNREGSNFWTFLPQGMSCLRMAVATCPPSANFDQGPAKGRAQGQRAVLRKGTWQVKRLRCWPCYVARAVIIPVCAGGEVPEAGASSLASWGRESSQ